MAVPLSQAAAITGYVLRQKWKRRDRYPLVLMLEPLMRCNLSCAGCGKIQYPSHVLKENLSLEACLAAADECGAPVVSIAGGEPLLHPDMTGIVRGLIEQKRYVYLCSNALLLKDRLDQFAPNPRLTFSIHMDGLGEDHDMAVCRDGVYEVAKAGVQEAVRRGFRVTTNTTLFDQAQPDRVRAFFDEMMALGVEGMMLSPGYSYEKAPDQDSFLKREATHNLFRRILGNARRSWRFNQSPLFLEFLAGVHDFRCTPWGNPTFNVFGWQRPCYLLQDGYADSFEQLMKDTEWDRYGHHSGNPKCRDCMVHSGYEATAVDATFATWRGFVSTVRATLAGPTIPRDSGIPGPPAGSISGAPTPFRQGFAVEEASAPEVVREALHGAFAYRGLVTLTLQGGESIEAYVTNVSEKMVDLWPKLGERRRIPLDAIRGLRFTGRDMADGRTYEAWLKGALAKKERAKREKEHTPASTG